MDKAIRLLLQNNGQGFLEEYYKKIDEIYNYRIPLKDIASKGKVKSSLADYKKACQTVTKAGSKKSRQAWMELALQENLNVNLGETIYYINTGKIKSEADVKKIVHFMAPNKITGVLEDMTKEYQKENKAYRAEQKKRGEKQFTINEYVEKFHPEAIEQEEIQLKCQLLPRDIIESDHDVFCSDGIEYNVPKYVEQFNKRITPLLVCFSKTIRDRILITNPDDRPYFTEEEAKLVSGEPNSPGDQDTYEQLMTMEDKEIKFWMEHPQWEIPFLKDCGMNWNDIKTDYIRRMEEERQRGIDLIRAKFEQIVESLTSDDMKSLNDGTVPSSISKIANFDAESGNFISIDFPEVVLGNLYDIATLRDELLM